MKPTVRSFNQLTEMVIEKYERYLPNAFDESLTILEKVNKVIEYLNSVGKLTNEVVTQWNAVIDWVMEDGLGETMNERLQAMYEDGTLAQIINVQIMGSLTNLKTVNKSNLVSAINENVDAISGQNETISEKFAEINTSIEAQYETISEKFAEINTSIEAQLAEIALQVTSYGAKGDGVTDNLDKLNNAVIDAKLKGKSLMLPPGVYAVRDNWVLPPNITVIFNDATIKLLNPSSTGGVITNVWNGGEGITLFTDNITLINPKIDGNNISGENGFGFTNCKNINIYNPQVKNCLHDKVKQGGRAIQFEGGINGVKDCNTYNPVIRNCSIGLNSQGTSDEPAVNISFFNSVMENVDTPFNFDSTGGPIGAVSHEEMSILVDGFSLRNCGKVTGSYGQPLGGGILTLDRAYGITIKNGKVVNSPSYGKIGGLVRGKGRNIQIDNVSIAGDVVALFNCNPRGFQSSAQGTVPLVLKAKNIRHFGTVDYAIKGRANEPTDFMNCLLESIELDVVSNGIVDSYSTYATSCYGEFRRKSDNASLPLMSFKSLYECGNGFINENKEGFREIYHVKKSVPDETQTGLFEVDIPLHGRLFIEFFVTCSFVESSTSASGVAIKGIATAVSDGNGSIFTDIAESLMSSTSQTNTTQTISISMVKDEAKHKVIFAVTQNNEPSGIAQTVMVNAKVGCTNTINPTKANITLL